MAKAKPAAKRGRRRASPGQRPAPEDEGRRRKGPRAFWSGTITFGLVSVPVELFPATAPGHQRLRMLAADGVPLRRVYYCPHDDREVARESLVRGYELEDGRHVVLMDDELEKLAPRRSRDIDLRRFVPVESIDPAYVDRAYYLTPGSETTKPYRLLAEVMESAGRAGIATFVMRGKEYLVAILAEGGILRAETMRFHDEVRSAEEVGLPEARPAPRARVAAIGAAIDELMADELEPEVLQDLRALRLDRVVSAKSKRGEDLVEAPPVDDSDAATEERMDAGDLLAAIKASLRALEKDGRPGDGAALAKLSKAELYERAAELEVPGRSAMTKADLVDALRDRGA